MRKAFISFGPGLFLLFALQLMPGPGLLAQGSESTGSQDSSYILHIMEDSLFRSPQRISMVFLDKDLSTIRMDLAFHSTDLHRTSHFAAQKEAVIAINGSFFDRIQGGSVTYLEIQDSVIHRTKADTLRWSVPDSLANGAIVLSRKRGLQISVAQKDDQYEESEDEIFVLVCGPLLIHQSLPQELPDMGFTHKRHPRSCLGITEESLIFMTVDGRTEQAAGMNLMELQSYLLKLGCTDAVNLDGGGSTTLWTSSLGVVNKPSDASGERPVANALVIVPKQAP